jgi:hypothetical protein
MESFGKTPLDLGARPDQLDPAWQEAMEHLKCGFNAAQQQFYDSLKT